MIKYKNSFTVHPQGYAADLRLRSLNITAQYTHYQIADNSMQLFTAAKVARKTFLFSGWPCTCNTDDCVAMLCVTHGAGDADVYTGGSVHRQYDDNSFAKFDLSANFDYNGYTEYIMFPNNSTLEFIGTAIQARIEAMLNRMALSYCDALIAAKRV